MVMKPQAYEEFAELYFKEFGERLSPLETRLMADRLMKLYRKVVFHKSHKGEDKNDKRNIEQEERAQHP